MTRTLAIAFAAVLALNAVVGTVALTRTLHLGQASHNASNVLVAKRTAQLDRFEASLRTQLAKKPPPLPKMPAAAPSGGTPISSPAAASSPQVRYVRPAPIIVHKHRAGGEEDDGVALAENDGGNDD